MVALVPQVEPEVLALAQQEEPAVARALVEALVEEEVQALARQEVQVEPLVEPGVPVLAQEPQAVAEWLVVPMVLALA